MAAKADETLAAHPPDQGQPDLSAIKITTSEGTRQALIVDIRTNDVTGCHQLTAKRMLLEACSKELPLSTRHGPF